MKFCFGHTSALHYWRLAINDGFRLSKPARTNLQLPGAASQEDTRTLLQAAKIHELFGETLSVVVAHEKDRRYRTGLETRICNQDLPRNSLVRVSNGISVASPELTFVQMSTILTFESLLLLGYELCGTYAIRPESEEGFEKRETPLTDQNALVHYIEKFGLGPQSKAAKAARFIRDGAASPAEAKLVLLLCLPTAQGGYGLPWPTLNQRIEILDSKRVATMKDHYAADLYWEEGKLDVEYDSLAYHLDKERQASDSARRNAITHLGITVKTVTQPQLASLQEMNDIASYIGKHLGCYIPPKAKVDTPERLALRRNLL